MATYPVKNRVTGEQKQVSMSIHEWDQWKMTIPIGTETGQILLPVQWQQTLASGKIN